MATVTKPIALDETLQATNLALAGIKEVIGQQNSAYLLKTGGALSEDVTTHGISPEVNDTYNLGSEAKEYLKVYTKELLTKYLALGGTRLTDAGFHNGIFRGKNITSYYTDGSLWNRIAGTNGYDLFEDLYVGDYFTTGSATINGTTKTWYWQIAGFDYFLRVGGNDIQSHHLVVVPCSSNGQTTDIICSMKMYESTPFTQGYLGSLPCQAMLGAQTISETTYSEGAIATGLKSIFGSHILPTSELLNTTNEGSNWQYYTMYGSLMSEIEVYGARIWGVDSGYDNFMSARGQLPLFRLKPSLISTRSSDLWLRSVSSASAFAVVNRGGNAGNTAAIYSGGIRPRFLIG